MPGAKEACARIVESGYNLIFVSNQAGIGEKLSSYQRIADIFNRMVREIYVECKSGLLKGPGIGWYFCQHTKEFGCECRKPKPGLLIKAMVDWEIKAQDCWMIGDARSDMKAGWNAGVRKLIKLPSLEEPDAPLYDYRAARHNFQRNTSSGLLLDNLTSAVDFVLQWDRQNA
jgi:D-glycero-D-manno-heptose 1,7-bisphosphate phosphatase